MQQITGKIVKLLPMVEGESASGKHWVKAGIVIEYGDEYPTKAAFTIFGEQKLQACAGLSEGMDVIVNYNPQSREYNERWYTDLQCVSVYPVAQQQPQQPVQQTPQQATSNFYQTQPTPTATMPQQSSSALPADSDLPF